MTIHVCCVPGRLPHGHTLQACPAENMSLIIHFIFGGKVAVCQESSFKNFSRLRKPALIERVIRLLWMPSAFAISDLLMPRK